MHIARQRRCHKRARSLFACERSQAVTLTPAWYVGRARNIASSLFANKVPTQLFQPSKVVYSPYGVSMDRRPTASRICRTRACNGALARAILTGYTRFATYFLVLFYSPARAPPHRNPVIPFVDAKDRNHHPWVHHKVLSALLFISPRLKRVTEVVRFFGGKFVCLQT